MGCIMKKYILMSENRTNGFVRAIYGPFIWHTKFFNNAKLFDKDKANYLAWKHELSLLEVTDENEKDEQADDTLNIRIMRFGPSNQFQINVFPYLYFKFDIISGKKVLRNIVFQEEYEDGNGTYIELKTTDPLYRQVQEVLDSTTWK